MTSPKSRALFWIQLICFAPPLCSWQVSPISDAPSGSSDAPKEHAQVLAAESRLDGWVPPLFCAASGGPCARLIQVRRAQTVLRGRLLSLTAFATFRELEYPCPAMEYAAVSSRAEATGISRQRHPFAMHLFADDAELDAALAEAGLWLERRLDARWFLAGARVEPIE